MTRWAELPRDRLLIDVSLWSADLASLGTEVERLSPFADSFHIDVADGRFAPVLLFFPDLVRALRPRTGRPFHVHLMVERPGHFVADFLSAGADLITVHAEADALPAIEAIRRGGAAAGLALLADTPLDAIPPYQEAIDAVLLLGTAPGVKGQTLAPHACARIREAADLVRPGVRIVADGGIRAATAPLLRRAGADVLAPGSLVFKSEDVAETFRWLRALQ